MTDNFINDFIKEYQKQPCLWQASCADFKNRKKRQDAYVKLIDVASKHGETYNIERTKQKINNLRCAFRVQLKKYHDCKNNPKNGKEEAYCPKRKYMDSLMFLINEETKPARRKSSTIESDDCQLIKRRNIDKELDALTMSLESESEDNIEQNEVIIETISEQKIDSNDNNNIISNEKLIDNTKMDFDDQQTTITKEDEQNFSGEILWSTISEIKTPTKSPQNITIRPNVPGRVVHVRTVKQASTPIVRQELQLINKKLNNTVTNNNTSIIKPVQKLRRLSNVNVVTSPPEKNFQKNITNSTTQSTTTTTTTTNTPIAISTQPTTAILVKNNPDNKLINNTVTSSSCERIKNDSTNFEKLLSLACTRINQIADSEDEYGIFGKMVTCKLRRMDQDQALIAQKQITNILFDGQMKLLQLDTKKQLNTTGVAQQLHSTTIRPIRNSTSSSATAGSGHYYITEINGNNTISSINDEQSVQFNTLTGETHILGK